jgi:glycerate-2-kinase
MKAKAEAHGVEVTIVTDALIGEAKEVAKDVVGALHKTKPNSMFLYGGETTVKVRVKGKGGRNLELGLSSLRFLEDNELLAAVASDGRDNTDFGGVICDTMTKKKAEELHLSVDEALEKNQSYAFFSAVSDYLMMGETGSNVSDLLIAYHATTEK